MVECGNFWLFCVMWWIDEVVCEIVELCDVGKLYELVVC